MTLFNKISNIINDVWFGRELLYKVFWLYKILIGGFLGVIFQILYINGLQSISMPILSFYFIYHIWVLNGLVKCRNNISKFHSFIPNLTILFVGINAVSLIIFVLSFIKKTITL